jgi:hypothetical protein
LTQFSEPKADQVTSGIKTLFSFDIVGNRHAFRTAVARIHSRQGMMASGMVWPMHDFLKGGIFT